MSKNKFSSLEKDVLEFLQANFPVAEQPFSVLAEKLHCSAEEVLNTIKKLKNEGYIRRIGAFFDSKKLGYTSTLCAMKVPADKLPLVIKTVNALDQVTHNYLREYEYNIWFTLLAPTEKELKNIIEHIKMSTGIEDILNLPTVETFKIKVNFNLKERE